MKERRYVASALQSLPVTRPALWDQSTLEETRVPVPLEGQIVSRNGKALRERIQRRGVLSMSSGELLSVSLGGNEKVVQQIETLLTNFSLQQLLHADFGQLAVEYRLGETKAAQLQAILEVARRLFIPSMEEKYQIKCPADAANLVRTEMEYLDHEEMRVLSLDTKNQVVSNQRLYQGTVNASALRGAEIFRTAVARNCPAIIVCHNHPSGDPTPSPEDIQTTEQLVEAGKVLDIELLDHIIINDAKNDTRSKTFITKS